MPVTRDERGRFLRTDGRPKGTRNRQVRAAECLPPDAVPQLFTALYEQALQGDTSAAGILLARLDPLRKGAAIALPEVPAITDPASAQAASARVLELVTTGVLSAEEGKALQELIARHVEVADAAALRADVDRLLEHAGLPHDARPGAVGSPNGSDAVRHD